MLKKLRKYQNKHTTSSILKKNPAEDLHLKYVFSIKEKINIEPKENNLCKSCPDLKNMEKKYNHQNKDSEISQKIGE